MAGAVSFGYKMSWLAVRSSSPAEVARALEIDHLKPSAWAAGIEQAYASSSMTAHSAFVTPELGGWVLVVSPAFFAEASDVDPERLIRFVDRAAQRLATEVQVFITHRVVEGHGWARTTPEGVARAYSYLGEIGECLLDAGDRTPFEETLACLGPDASDPADEETVMSVAAAWSLDPTTLDTGFPDADDGLLGTITAPETSPPDDAAQAEDTRPWWRFW